MEQIKLLIIDSAEGVEETKSAIAGVAEIEIVGEVTDGCKALMAAKELTPDVVVMDILLPGKDGLDLVNELKANNKDIKVIVQTTISSASLASRAMEMGADYFMIKPVDGVGLIKRIKELYASKHKNNGVLSKRLDEKITNIFLTVGIPAHIKGYQFLREAIKMAVEDPRIINSITKKLYPGIAEVYDTTASKVERAIRHAIEVAWNKGKIENINDVFGLRVYDTHEKPTNGEFIALVTDKMLLENY